MRKRLKSSAEFRKYYQSQLPNPVLHLKHLIFTVILVCIQSRVTNDFYIKENCFISGVHAYKIKVLCSALASFLFNNKKVNSGLNVIVEGRNIP